jgi:hypothetical protein
VTSVACPRAANISTVSEERRVIDVVVEIPKGSRNKYEWDPERGIIKLDRRLFSAMTYPADYGFIPETLAEDGDPLDALVVCDDPTFPGCWIDERPPATRTSAFDPPPVAPARRSERPAARTTPTRGRRPQAQSRRPRTASRTCASLVW